MNIKGMEVLAIVDDNESLGQYQNRFRIDRFGTDEYYAIHTLPFSYWSIYLRAQQTSKELFVVSLNEGQ